MNDLTTSNGVYIIDDINTPHNPNNISRGVKIGNNKEYFKELNECY